ncbi:MAG: hypothetical protein RL754_666 [Bacteroidota bacterium]|jgi:hypothetical protein
MDLRRFYTILLFSVLSMIAQAQPYWQKGVNLGQFSAAANLNVLDRHAVDANANLKIGTATFLSPRWAVGATATATRTPMTQSLGTTAHLQYKTFGRSDLRHSLLLGTFAGGTQNTNWTLTGTTFGNRAVLAGVSAQYTYWMSSSVGIYVWPHLARTNGGPSGLWEWSLNLPVGVQWAWYK